VLRLRAYFYHREHLFIVTELLKDNLYEFQKYLAEAGEPPYFSLPRIQRVARQTLQVREQRWQVATQRGPALLRAGCGPLLLLSCSPPLPHHYQP
jgi:hypothetical protein